MYRLKWGTRKQKRSFDYLAICYGFSLALMSENRRDFGGEEQTFWRLYVPPLITGVDIDPGDNENQEQEALLQAEAYFLATVKSYAQRMELIRQGMEHDTLDIAGVTICTGCGQPIDPAQTIEPANSEQPDPHQYQWTVAGETCLICRRNLPGPQSQVML